MSNILLLGMPGTPEIMVIFLGILIFFGGKKIPELMKGVGKGIREFNNAKDQVRAGIQEGMAEADNKRQSEIEAARQRNMQEALSNPAEPGYTAPAPAAEREAGA